MSLFGPPNIEKMEAKKDVKGLIKALEYKKDTQIPQAVEDIRHAAAKALGKLGDARAVEPLILALELSDYCNYATIEALCKFRDARVVEPLIKALKIYPETAAEALGKLGDARAVEPLIESLGRADYYEKDHSRDFDNAPYKNELIRNAKARAEAKAEATCKAVAEALGKLGDARAVEPLIMALGYTIGNVRKAVAATLDKLGESKWKQIITGDLENDFAGLANSKDIRAIKPLVRALDNRNWNIRRAAIEALGKRGDPRAVEPLIMALRDKDMFIRKAAAETLGKLGDACAVEPLIKALGDDCGDIRVAAATALDKLGESQWKQIITGVDLENDFTGLAKSKDARAVKTLIMALGYDKYISKAAALSLINLG